MSTTQPTPTPTPTGPALTPEYLAQNDGYKVTITSAVFVALTTIALGLRIFSRKLQKRSSWIWADVYMPVSYVINLGTKIACILSVNYGTGRHVEAVPPDQLINYFKMTFLALPVLYGVGVNLPKLAVLDIYRHVFTDKISRGVTWLTLFIIVASTISNVPSILAQCLPVAYLWDPTIPGGHCIDIQAHYLWASFPNIVSDVMMLVLPIPTIKKLQLARGPKIGLFFTFLLGNAGLITSILRFVSFTESITDPTWFSGNVLIYTVVEMDVYFLCACFITYRPLFRWLVHDSPMSSIIQRRLLSHRTRGTSNSERTQQNTSVHGSPMRLESMDKSRVKVNEGSMTSSDRASNNDTDVERQTGAIHVQYEFERSSLRDE